MQKSLPRSGFNRTRPCGHNLFCPRYLYFSMEKVQTLLWILLGLSLFVWRMVQKARATMAQEQRERPAATVKAPPLPSTSFDDLLKQMQAQNRTGNPASATPGTPPSPPRPVQVMPSSLRPPETTSGRRPLVAQSEGKSMDVLPSYNSSVMGEERRSAPRREQNALTARSFVADRLANPADLRAAFVLGEILQRRF